MRGNRKNSNLNSNSINEKSLIGLEWEKELPENGNRLSTGDRKEMNKLELLLPLQALIAYRQQAVTETLLRAYESSIIKNSLSSDACTENLLPSSSSSSSSSSTTTTTTTTTTTDSVPTPVIVPVPVPTPVIVPVPVLTPVIAPVPVPQMIFNNYKEKKEISTVKKIRSMLTGIFKRKVKKDRTSAKLSSILSDNKDDDIYNSDDVSMEDLAAALLNDVNNRGIERDNEDINEGEGKGEEEEEECRGGGIKERNSILFKLKISACVSILVSDVVPVIDVEVSMGGDLTARSVSDVEVDCYVKDLQIHDLVTPTSAKKTLLSFITPSLTQPVASSASSSSAASSLPSSSSAASSSSSLPSSSSASSSLVITREGVMTGQGIKKFKGVEDHSSSSSSSNSSSSSSSSNSSSSRRRNGSSSGNEDDKLERRMWLQYTSTTDGSSQLLANADPLEVVLNVQCLLLLLDLIVVPASKLMKIIKLFNENDYIKKCSDCGTEGVITDNTASDMATQLAVVIVGDKLDIIVTVSAPKIILPYNSSKNDGFFVLDLGQANLSGYYSAITGLSLTLNVSDLCAGITPPGEMTSKNINMGYLLQPVGAILTFSTLNSDRTLPQPRDPCGDHLHSNSTPIILSDLIVKLKLNSELKIILTGNKIIDIIHYGRIFISFVWNVSTICTYYLSDSTRYIIHEKLAEGLHTLNNLLNPSINLFKTNNNNSSTKWNIKEKMNVRDNNKRNKQKYSSNSSGTSVSDIFSRLINNISITSSKPQDLLRGPTGHLLGSHHVTRTGKN